MIKIIGYILISLGVLADLLGAFAMVRFRDTYTRLEAGVKCALFGTCAILFGVFVLSGASALGIKALLCALFVGCAAPVLMHAIARSGRTANAIEKEKQVNG